jgi:peptidyl-prolyl cis-trans isomerase B (cyclophilin B)
MLNSTLTRIALSGLFVASTLGVLPNALAEKLGALMETSKGNILIEFYDKEAPKTTAHIKALIARDFYDQGMRFHRVVPGFVIQTGDPTNTGTGGCGVNIPLEVNNDLGHVDAGIVAMARGQGLDSASSQFYITLDRQSSLDAKYTIFGRVIQGMDVIPMIDTTDKIYTVELVDIENAQVENDAPKQEHPFWSIFKPRKGKKK